MLKCIDHSVVFCHNACQALKAMQRIFPCEKELMHQIPLLKIVQTYRQQLQQQKQPFLIRVAGQSGSGKSSQLVPALEEVLQSKSYVKISVGMFAPFHPNYDIWQKSSPSQMRERTNGFALRALYLFYCYCIKNRVNILLDMTLLEPEIEYYFAFLAKCQGYHVMLHVLAVPKKVSDFFIHKRQCQTGRCVSPQSAQYFFSALPRALKSLLHLPVWIKSDQIWLWTHNQMSPLMRTTFFNSHVMHVFAKAQRNRQINKKEKCLLAAKKRVLRYFVEAL